MKEAKHQKTLPCEAGFLVFISSQHKQIEIPQRCLELYGFSVNWFKVADQYGDVWRFEVRFASPGHMISWRFEKLLENMTNGIWRTRSRFNISHNLPTTFSYTPFVPSDTSSRQLGFFKVGTFSLVKNKWLWIACGNYSKDN
jgi:hypothetical protein